MVVAEELEGITVKSVGARLSNGIDDRAAEFPIFRVEAVGDQAEFLNGVQVGYQTCPEVTPLADVSTVYQESVRRFSLAVHGDVAGAQNARYRTGISVGGTERAGAPRRNARLQAQKVDVAAAIQRQRQHFLRVDYIAKLRVFRLYLHGIGFHLDHFLLNGADLQSYIDLQLIIHLHDDAGLDEIPESACGNRQLIIAGGHREDSIGTVRTRGLLVFQIRFHIGDGESGASDRALRMIAHDTLNRSGYVGAHSARTKKYCEHEKKSGWQRPKAISHWPLLKWRYSYTKQEKNQALVSIYSFLFRSITFLDRRACFTTRLGCAPDRINSKLISKMHEVESLFYYYKRGDTRGTRKASTH